MRLKLAAVSVVAVALMLGTSSCGQPRQNFDAWIAQQGFTVKHEPVPCAIFPRNCGGTGQTDIVNKIIYLDDARIASQQLSQNLRDPSIDVMTFMEEHGPSDLVFGKCRTPRGTAVAVSTRALPTTLRGRTFRGSER